MKSGLFYLALKAITRSLFIMFTVSTPFLLEYFVSNLTTGYASDLMIERDLYFGFIFPSVFISLGLSSISQSRRTFSSRQIFVYFLSPMLVMVLLGLEKLVVSFHFVQRQGLLEVITFVFSVIYYIMASTNASQADADERPQIVQIVIKLPDNVERFFATRRRWFKIALGILIRLLIYMIVAVAMTAVMSWYYKEIKTVMDDFTVFGVWWGVITFFGETFIAQLRK